jgi:hypothetical protein
VAGAPRAQPKRFILPYGSCIQGLKDHYVDDLVSMLEFELLLSHVLASI